MRFECKHCGAILQLGLKAIQQGSLYSCPQCRADWALLGGGGPTATNVETAFLRFSEVVNAINRVCKEAPIGFSLRFEIRDDNEKREIKTTAEATG